MSDANPSTSSRRSATRPRRALALPVAGAGVDEIGAKRKISRNRIEDMLRDELRRLWVAPVEEFARLQIARLDAMILKLVGRVQDGDLEAIDRALMIINSLDRLPGFAKVRCAEPYSEEARARLLQKLNDVAARLGAERPAE
jgi:hypothetical protein